MENIIKDIVIDLKQKATPKAILEELKEIFISFDETKV